jgi:hypothetical protein
MKYHGKQGAEWGFKNPVEGWFDVVITDDIDILTNKDTGKSSLRIPTKVVSGEMAGANISIFCPMSSDFGEQKVADVIENIGLMKKFDEKFPGEVSFFDAAVIRQIQHTLPGKGLRLKLEPFTGKDGKEYGTIVKIDKAGSHAAEPAKAAAPAATQEEDW